MKQKAIVKILVTGLLVVSLSLNYFAGVVVAGNYSLQGGASAARGIDQPDQLFGDGGIFQQITNVLLFAIGVLSVVMLIIGGLRYVISGGNKDAVNSAKNTILYAIVGLIVSLLSYAVVDFVIRVFSGNSFGGGTGGTNV